MNGVIVCPGRPLLRSCNLKAPMRTRRRSARLCRRKGNGSKNYQATPLFSVSRSLISDLEGP